MTIKEYMAAIKNKDGSYSQAGLKKLTELENGMNVALNAVKKYLVKNPPREVKGYNNWYVDYHNMQKALVKAENQNKSSSITGLTHYQITKPIPVKMLVNNQIVEAPKTYVVTFLNYKGLDKAFGAVPVQKTVNNRNNSSQNFGGSLTSAERQSLGMVFGIGARQGDTDNGGFNNNNNNNWNRNSFKSNNNFNQNNNGGFNNNSGNFNQNNGGAPRNFSQAGASKSVTPTSRPLPNKNVTPKNNKTVVKKPQVKTINDNQFNNIKHLIMSTSSSNHADPHKFINFAKTAGGLNHNISLINLPKKKYTSVINQLKMLSKSNKSTSKSTTKTKSSSKSKTTKK